MTTVGGQPEPPISDVRVGDGSRVTLAGALRRYALIALVVTIAFVAAGITLAARRHPVYSASSQLNVGVTDAASDSTPGYVQAAQELASAYSQQAISASLEVVVARKLGIATSQVSSRVSSPAVPDSSTFYVDATGPTPRQAEHLSVVASQVLRRQVNAALQSRSAARMLTRYRLLERRANALSGTAGALAAQAKQPNSRITRADAQNAQLASDVAQLQAGAQSQQYISALTGQSTTNLQILNPAQTASSDRRKYLERFGIVGLLAGLVVGGALTYLVALAASRRRRPAP